MMNQTVQQTTQKLLDLLPDNEEHYRLDELRSWGIPPFIVQRIRVELERNLAESMILPTTDWANIQTVAVQNAWEQFVQAIRDEARLPASYAKAVIETAVADVLDMLTEPRKNIPDVIFGSDDELSFDILQKRIKSVVVYQHFATLLPRYMQKKQLEVLSRERCEKIIQKTDERLASNYSPLNWAQMLDPLFNLLDDQIDPTLLRLFFEDKDRPKIAEIFDRRDEALSRAEFIEILSAPDLTDTPQPEPLEAPSSQVQEEDARESEGSESEQDEVPEVVEHLEQSAPKASREKESEVEERKEEISTKNADDSSYDKPLNTNFAEWDKSQETSSNSNGSHGRDDSISALFSEPQDQQESHAEEESGAVEQKEEDKEPSDQKQPETEEEQVDKEDPIWMRFMSEDEKNELVEQESEEDSVIDIEEQASGDDETEIDEEDKEPVIHQPETKKDLGTEELKEVGKLEEQLVDRHDHFVKAIFEGSEQAYEEALKDIVEFESWREASKYIQKHIFSQNRVDLYSESAVAFTDRLQNYFLAKENRMNG